MNNINELHDKSMDLAELALTARSNKNLLEARELFSESLKLELKAIEELENINKIEPSYSILLRSAASLAIDCNDNRLAEKLIGKALANEPPYEIAEELKDLLEQLNFARHLQLRGTQLNDDELQMSLAGNNVGYGMIQSEEFIPRIETFSKLVYRTIERRKNIEFRVKGRPKKKNIENSEIFMSVPRAACFAVTLKIGRPNLQQNIPGIFDYSGIIDEIMNLMDSFNSADYDEIEKIIPNSNYRNNFIQLARNISPDGEQVKFVGFTSLRQGNERFVKMTTPKSSIEFPLISSTVKEGPSERATIKGILKFADATHSEKGHIKVIEENGKTKRIQVPDYMMDDIVKPLWNCNVVITGIQCGNEIILENIDEYKE